MAMCIRYLCGFQYYCYMLCFAVLFVLLHHHYFNVKLSGDRIKHQDTDPTEWRFNIVIVSFPHTMLCVLCKCQPQFLNIYPTNWFVSVGTIQVTAKKKHKRIYRVDGRRISKHANSYRNQFNLNGWICLQINCNTETECIRKMRTDLHQNKVANGILVLVKCLITGKRKQKKIMQTQANIQSLYAKVFQCF